jgi:hypothetical protein
MIGFRPIIKNVATNWLPVNIKSVGNNRQLVMTNMNQGQPHPYTFLKFRNSFLGQM